MATEAPGAETSRRSGEGWRRLAWFVGIWAASAAAVIAFGWIVRKVIGL